ncbi:hypothetical protein MUY27_13810 [Mucilaginibacter sp. RS28]|uniref:Uncharacterized protein n=1 Tax=Mucilaginibacter straminoryzae TaxID=2932774 RepID=A0A9X1X4A7_9SPHI|nr:hypothetical protein [Mucilaginibacter straminoryzae]MCJ8210789.1 hypothetical protein [Mucilaginibacter straminoryzae]
MKKLVSHLNPFILLLIPVLIALVMGIGYQAEQAKQIAENTNTPHATSLFYKSVGLVKAVCAIAQQQLW